MVFVDRGSQASLQQYGEKVKLPTVGVELGRSFDVKKRMSQPVFL